MRRSTGLTLSFGITVVLLVTLAIVISPDVIPSSNTNKLDDATPEVETASPAESVPGQEQENEDERSLLGYGLGFLLAIVGILILQAVAKAKANS